MELNNEFRVSAEIDDAWEVLTDVERIAPCMPGAALTEVAGDEYRGTVKIKVGPVTVRYRGTARFESLDADSHVVVLAAHGRETQGQGKFQATVRAELIGEGTTTLVCLRTDLDISGRVAQFGRGVISDVSNAILDQFVTSLESSVLRGSSVAEDDAAPGDHARADGVRSEDAGRRADLAPDVDVPALDVLNLVGVRAGQGMAAFLAGAAAVGVVLLVRRALVR